MLEQPGFSREIDPRAVAAFLAFNSVPAPMTIFAEARKLPAGSTLAWRDGGIERAPLRAARPGPGRPRSGAGRRRQLADELRETLRDSVRAHLVADVPVGVLLSGGVDSAGLTALAAGESSEPVRTFSIGFEEASFDELERARLVAEPLRAPTTTSWSSAPTPPSSCRAWSRPSTSRSATPRRCRPTSSRKLAAGEVKVALSGEGGDELFGGYYTYVADLLAPRVAPLAALAAPLVEALPSSDSKVSLDYKAKRFVRGARLPALERHHAWKEIFPAPMRASLLGERGPGWDPVDLLRERYAETEGAEPLARLQDLDLGIYMVDDLLVKTDRSSMAHSLELRVPFLDQRVAEFALGLATPLKVRGFAKKRLLRRALAPLLPKEIVARPKQGFSIPLAAWLRGPLEPFARETLSTATLERQGCLDPAVVTPILDRHCSGEEDLSRQLWGLMSFTLWFDRYAR